tara:strand:- start:1160 stop:1534 length:375 start_codon:yes stop_codon:yes gene_type:complete
MSKETAHDYFGYYTQKAGDIVRQLGLVGVGAVWTLHTILDESPESAFDHELKFTLVLICMSLSVDLLQYIVGSVVWGINWHNNAEQKAHTHTLTIGLTAAFIAFKLIIMGLAYLMLLLIFLEKF